MKTKLVKLALCAMAALPIGAWADIDFGTEEVVSSTTTWIFDEYTTSDAVTTGISCRNKLYNRSASSGRGFKIVELDSPESYTFSDGNKVTVKKIARTENNYSFNNTDAKPYAKYMTAAATSITVSDESISVSNDATPFFAFNTSVGGTCYALVKGSESDIRIYFGKADGSTALTSEKTTTASEVTEIKLHSDVAGVFFIGGVTNSKNREIYAIRFVPDEITVSEETTWTFNERSTEETYQTSSIVNKGDGLYIRGGASNKLVYTAVPSESQTKTFADGTEVTCMVMVTPQTSITNYNNKTAEAYTAGSNMIPTIAFKTTVPGTVYALVEKAGDTTPKARIHFCDGTNPQASKIAQSISTSGVKEISYHSNIAGTFFICSSDAKINVYAVRFVPEIKTTIGSHGMSSFSCAQGLDFSKATPDGLKAYRAKEVNTSGLVVLSSVDEAPAETGLILSGEDNTEYTIPVKDDAASVGLNLMVGTITETAVAASTSSVHNYIWAYTTASGLGFYNVATATTSAAGKAYLSTGATALNTTTPARGFIFEDEDVTGIDVVKGSELKANGEYFNLNGQRVAQPTRGLYIVNGKKVVIK